MFAGDFIMPYLGAPFVEEGSFDGRLARWTSWRRRDHGDCCTDTVRSPTFGAPRHAADPEVASLVWL